MKRKVRILLVILGLWLYPAVSYAQVPTTDPLGTSATVKQTVQNIQTKAQQVMQMQAIQTTMTSVGGAVKGAVAYCKDVKNNIEEQLEKVKKYKKVYEQYKAEFEAYKKQYEELKSQVEDAKNQIENAVDQAKNAVETAKAVAENAGDIVQSQIDKVTDKLEEKTGISLPSSKSDGNSGTSGADSGDGDGDGTGNGGDGSGSEPDAGNGGDNGTGNGGDGSGSEPSAGNGGDNGDGEGEPVQSGLVDSPTQEPSRTPIDTSSPSENEPAPIDGEGNGDDGGDDGTGNGGDGSGSEPDAGNGGDDGTGNGGDGSGSEPDAGNGGDDGTGNGGDGSGSEPDAGNGGDDGDNGNDGADDGTGYGGVSNGAIEQTPITSPNGDTDTTITIIPSRQPFTVSQGYGRMHTSFALANASLLPDNKTGTTPDNDLIVPSYLMSPCKSMGYDLNYKTAGDAEEAAYDSCLSNLNEQRTDSNLTKEKREEVSQVLWNAYADFTASAYLTAFNIYNESLNFKKKKVAPVLSSKVTSVDDGWTYVEQMDELIGSRLAKWALLSGRMALYEMFEQYVLQGLTNEQDE